MAQALCTSAPRTDALHAVRRRYHPRRMRHQRRRPHSDPSFVTTSTGSSGAGISSRRPSSAQSRQRSTMARGFDFGSERQPRPMRYVRASEGGACDHAGCDTHPVTDSHADARADPTAVPTTTAPPPQRRHRTDHGAGPTSTPSPAAAATATPVPSGTRPDFYPDRDADAEGHSDAGPVSDPAPTPAPTATASPTPAPTPRPSRRLFRSRRI